MNKKIFNKKSINKEQGITLIALIITIIILVILAAVSIRAVYNMGIVDQAVNGTQKYAQEAVKENQMLDDTGSLIEGTIEKLEEISTGLKKIKNPYKDKQWTYAYAYVNGEWGTSRIVAAAEENNEIPSNATIVAYFYEQDETITPAPYYVSSTMSLPFAPGKAYKMVIEGTGNMGPMATFTGGKNFTNITAVQAWQNETLAYAGALMQNVTPQVNPLIPYVTEVSICEGITDVGDYAFLGGTSLETALLASTITTIGEDSFCRTALTSIEIQNNVTEIGIEAFAVTPLTSITIPDSVTTIGISAFNSCNALTSVTIGNNVATIGRSAFYDCDALTSVIIGNSVTTIGQHAFYDCDALTSITIPDSVTTIGQNAFNSCNALTSVTIPDSVTTIGNGAFESCYQLTSVTIGNSVTTIGNYAFYDCGLSSISIPNSVTTIGDFAFWFCSFRSVTIPSRVTSIGNNAFEYCSVLQDVYIESTGLTVGNNAFSGMASPSTIYVKNNAVETELSGKYPDHTTIINNNTWTAPTN